MSAVTAYELAQLLREHKLWRKRLATSGNYGPTTSARPPAKSGQIVKSYWWCKTCGVDISTDDTRSWEVLETEHQADVVLALLERAS